MINLRFPRPSLAVIFIFFLYWSCYTHNKASGGNIFWRIASFHVLFYLQHLFRRQNGPKPVKFENKLYKTVITFFLNKKLKKIVTLTMHVLRSVCPNGSQKHMHLACLTLHLLPVFYLCIRYIEGRTYLAICFPTYFRVTKLFQPSPCLYSHSFPSIHACKVYISLYRNPQQKSNLIDFEPL
jgi:hypothetical protein